MDELVPIAIDHHRTAKAHCKDCGDTWETNEETLTSQVLTLAAEHVISTGHSVEEHVADDALVHRAVA